MAIVILNTTQVAELTGIKKSKIVGLRKRGLGPKTARVGREYLYSKEEVEEWMKSLFSAE